MLVLSSRFHVVSIPPRCHRPSLTVRPLRPLRILCADEDKEQKTEEKQQSAEARFAEQLKKQGFKKESAQKILQVWKEGGAASPDELRRLFLRGSLRPLGVVLIQLLLDAGATFGSFIFSASFSAAPGIPPFIFSTLGTLAGFYFLTSTAFDIVTLGAILFSIYRFGANTEAFLAALEAIAGTSDIPVIEKAKKIVDVFKVIQALNQIADILRVASCKNHQQDVSSRRKGLERFLLWRVCRRI